jgi:hypothetical protein
MKSGSDSILFCSERTFARPKNGRFTVSVHRERPLQEQLPPSLDDFVEATPSRAVRDGEGMFFSK